MSDHLWLINTRGIFRDARYILRVAPGHKKPTEVEINEEAAEDMGEFVATTIVQSTANIG